MKESNRIIQIIDEKLHVINQKIGESKKGSVTGVKDYVEYRKKVEEALKILKSEKRLSSSIIENPLVYTFCDSNRLPTLRAYTEVSKSMYEYDSNFILDDTTNKFVTQVYESILDSVISYINEMTKVNIDPEMSAELKKLEKLKKKINDNYNLDEDDVDYLFTVLSGINDEKELLKDIYFKIIDRQSMVDINSQDVIFENHIELEVSELEEVFAKYGYNFNELVGDTNIKSNKELLSLLQKFGNIDRIDSIFATLQEHDINLNHGIEGHTILSLYRKKLVNLLIYSDSDIIEDIFARLNNGVSISKFSDLLDVSQIFIKLKRKKVGKNVGGTGGSGKGNVSGAYEHFCANVELLKSFGVNIDNAIHTNPDFFTAAHSTVLDSCKNFELYGIDSDVYSKTLTCLVRSKQLDSLDKFIELGCFNYAKDNLSKILDSDTYQDIFYQISQIIRKGVNVNAYMKKQVNGLTFQRKKYYEDFGDDSVKSFYDLRDRELYLEALDKEKEKYYSSSENPAFSIYEGILSESKNNEITSVSLEDPRVALLDKKYRVDDGNGNVDEFLYDFDGVKISRFKVLRLFETLKKSFDHSDIFDSKEIDYTGMLLYAIVRNSIITDEEFRELEKVVNKVCGRGLK